MVKKFFKKESKRVSCKKRYKIEKRVRDHNRSLRLESKKKKRLRKSKKPQVHIPNKCPFKEEILVAAQQKRAEIDEEKLRRKEEMKTLREAERQKLKNKGRVVAQTLESLSKEAESRQQEFEENAAIKQTTEEGSELSANSTQEKTAKAFYSEVKKVVEAADVIIEVLDARDPLGSRCDHIEKAVLGSNKRLVLLLNKIDLVPKKNIEEWLNLLRKELPVVAFKASTQEQRRNLGFGGKSPTTTKCVGADILMKLLGNYCRNKDIKTLIKVGIVGYPNVGKSSVINSLKRNKSCQTGATPGLTRSIQEVELDKKIRLIDSPGVVMTSSKAFDPSEAALKNALKIETLADPVAPIEALLKKCPKDLLMLQYNIPDFADVDGFLGLMARKIGKLRKGGVPDKKAAAKKVLGDWNTGKIRYYTTPPEDTNRPTLISAELVQEFSKEFSLDDLDKDQTCLVNELPITPDDFSAVPLSSREDVVMETDGLATGSQIQFDTVATAKKDGSEAEPNDEAMDESTAAIPGNQQLNRKQKAKLKKALKRRKKSDKLSSSLSDKLSSAMDFSQRPDYDFKKDFKGVSLS